jgi:predicted DNA-binding transcriptional regulator YafY
MIHSMPIKPRAIRKKKDIEAKQFLRLLRLLQYMQTPRTIAQSATFAECTPRTIYRYLHLFEQANYQIIRHDDGSYRVQLSSKPIDEPRVVPK